jgi:protease-4
MKQFLVTIAGVFAGLALFFIGLPFLLLALAAGAARPPATPGAAVLSLDLRRGLTDQSSANPLAFLGRSPLSVMSVTQTLHGAERDGRVKALFVRLPESGMEPAAADELRLAFKRFEAAGKPVVVHSQGLYPSGVITSTYMLGASASQLWMQPGAPFQATGLASQELFFKRFFDKYGVKVNFEQRYEYKNAVNGYLYDDYTAAHREASLSWMGSIYQSALNAVAADRHMNPGALKTVIEAGPYNADDALAKGLIDKLGQVPEAKAAALALAGAGAKTQDFEDYAADAKASGGGLGGPVVAVVSAEGDIMTGPPGGGFSTASHINSDDVSDALMAAANDSSVKAIVFRLSSPGGSDTASEQILAAVRAAKAKKPIVVSMGTYGASGGYWVSSGASAIVAEPTTLTGSIGVFGGKFVLGEALSRFGVDMRQISVGGDYAAADGAGEEFTPKQRAAFSAAIDKVYDGFITRVSIGRHLPADRVRQIARGRVWTGAQALQLGLVDEVGGFYQAVDKAKALAGLSGQTVHLRTQAAHHSPFEAIERAMGVSSTSIRAVMATAQLLSDPQAQSLLDQIGQAHLRSQGANLLAPVRVR